MDKQIHNKQEAYNAYAAAMEKHNAFSKADNQDLASYWWDEAQDFWDLYFYWDETD